MVASYPPEVPMIPRRGHPQLLRDEVADLLAHDLKTPLAAIALNLDYVMSELGQSAPATVRGALEDCRQANQGAVGLVSDMVQALRLATGAERPNLAPVEAQSVLAPVIYRTAPEAATRGVRLTWVAEPETIRADAGLLQRAIERLLERALRRARGGGTVDVTLAAGSIVIRARSVDGAAPPGEPDTAMRALAIHFADAAVRAQGGAVWTETDGDGGLLFVVALPPLA
jgi:signal transduction histidine kinase